MSTWIITEEKLREYEYRRKYFEAGQAIHFCELEHGTILGEDDDEEKPDESLMENSEQDIGEMPMLEASIETQDSHGFQTKNL